MPDRRSEADELADMVELFLDRPTTEHRHDMEEAVGRYREAAQ